MLLPLLMNLGMYHSRHSRNRGKYRTPIPRHPEKEIEAKAALEQVLPPYERLDVTGMADDAEYARMEVQKILDFMEQEDQIKKARRRNAAYLLLLN